MEKVRLTQKQAEAMEKRKKLGLPEESVRCHIKYKWKGYTNKHLNELSLDQFIRALYIGYEVEPEFKVGDWVVDVYEGTTKIQSKEEEGLWIGSESAQMWVNYAGETYERLRHATPEEIAEEEERRFFARNGREPWELRRKDLLVINDMYDSIQDIYDGVYIFESGVDCDGSDLETLVKRGNIKVACFSHDRKDVDNE